MHQVLIDFVENINTSFGKDLNSMQVMDIIFLTSFLMYPIGTEVMMEHENCEDLFPSVLLLYEEPSMERILIPIVSIR
ncbi:Protein of unknown function [Gryllus bimaculatus]|nr:Protein of unknown function [Gryllus bimaculatus]